MASVVIHSAEKEQLKKLAFCMYMIFPNSDKKNYDHKSLCY